MSYILREMTIEDQKNALNNCGEREKNRLIRLRIFGGPRPHGWVIDDKENSYLFRSRRKGDPREDIREDYHFFYKGKDYYIITNGCWPLRVTYTKSEVSESQVNDFEEALLSAFSSHGLLGIVGKRNFVSDISIEAT